ncbi:AtpZ/AtpI family protein [Paenibacillus tarimensis]|uniref:AtpZ/AtpI family protein n=1 Tax=Paenibacillus tarimensis TaxID=416012 RepID=UPI001F263936|nr:AtpZ/AtpI family protein [Paenibacillus tarimensis]MCF2944180.1 AtpZ/AtpI family protein [Paenibacillus tarimensis]
MNKRENGDNLWRAAGLVGVMGLDIALCILLGYFLGNWLGGSRGWVVGGILAGLAVGIFSCIVLVKYVLEDSDG